MVRARKTNIKQSDGEAPVSIDGARTTVTLCRKEEVPERAKPPAPKKQ